MIPTAHRYRTPILTTHLIRAAVRLSTALTALVLAITCTARPVHAQTSARLPRMQEDKPGQLARATITPDSARALARGRVANGVIAEQGIEMEGGKLVYSFDMRVRGRSGIDEVLIDAMSGAVISVEHEGPAAEARERAQDVRERAAKRDSTRRP
jgi:uncharacterized membrane protein YkoI